MIAASVGMASNLAALRALATEGIQRGHMSLHARSVAVAAGAVGAEVENVALAIAESGAITLEAAKAVLVTLRA
jgi:hydroxymethylglutaryl-CoA reductase